MKKTCLVLLGLLWCAALPAKNFELKSPDGRIALAIDVGERIAYTVRGDGIPLLEECRLGLRLDRGGTAGPLRLVRHRSGSIDRTFRPAVAYKFSEIRDRCNTLRLDFRGGWSVEFRAYDDGVAYRFLSDTEGPVEVLGEEFALRLPDASTAVLQQPGSFRTGYEEAYEEVGTRSWGTAGRLAVLPALFDTKRGYKILVSESSLTDYPCLFLTGDGANGMRGVFPKMPLRTEETGDRSVRILEEAGCIAATTGERAFPWRYFVLADEDGDLVETTMTARLAEPCALGDTSWIEPGQVSWEFWNAASPYGPDVDFVAGFNTATYKYFIDFAARFGIPYIIMDEGWAEDTCDPYTPNPEVDLHELIRYGEECGVGVILWLTWLTVEKHFDLFERLSEWGVRGVKIDFMDRSDQWMVSYYERVTRCAAEHRLLVDWHGSYTPKGLFRTYPNLVNYEGVLGMEQGARCQPENSNLLPFIRNAVGPMDFTPGAMLSAQPEENRSTNSNPMGSGTRAYQLALYVLFEAPLQMLADSPMAYERERPSAEFIASVPTTWDELRVLHAACGKQLVVARRKGAKWYVGGFTNNEPFETEIALDFLPAGRKFRMTSFEDGVNADLQAMDYKRRVRIVDASTRIPVKMVRNGGWAAVIE